MAVLRASGENFDVDMFSARSSIPIDRVYRRGEGLLGARKRSKHKVSGLAATVSDASWLRLPLQIRDAEQFLLTYKREIMRLSRFPGVEDLVLEFSATIPFRRNFLTRTDRFPASLVRSTGKLGIALELRSYLTVSG